MSIVVVAYDMQRELPRTLYSLSARYQSGVDDVTYEILVVDNGSPVPIRGEDITAIDPRIRLHRVENASRSPAAAANAGIRMTSGSIVCLILDGARMVTPATLWTGIKAASLGRRVVATPLAWHLGPDHQSRSVPRGYGPAVEDRLLESISWQSDGYRLFEVSALAGANKAGFFGQVNESCCLFLHRHLWDEVGGLDERFDLPGGGFVSLDLFSRLVATPGSDLVVMLGEGSFHQVHGGASTSPGAPQAKWADHYKNLRGQDYRAPKVSPIYLGRMPEQARKWILPER